MNSNYNYLLHVEPDLVSRECGGWLARAPQGVAIRIAVTGETENDARENFSREMAIWVENLQTMI